MRPLLIDRKKESTSDPLALELNLVSNYKSLVDSGHFPITQKFNLYFNGCDTFYIYKYSTENPRAQSSSVWISMKSYKIKIYLKT